MQTIRALPMLTMPTPAADSPLLPPPTPPDRLLQGVDNHFVVAVSGHRDLLAADTTYRIGAAGTLETLVQKKLLTIVSEQISAGRAGVVVVSPLAEGADCLVAWVALQLQQAGQPIQVRVILPYNPEAYLSERDAGHQALIRQLIGQAAGYAILPTGEPEPVRIDVRNPAHKAFTNRAYVALCVWLTGRADAAIVLWDGVDTAQSGGTSDFVRLVIFGEDSAGTRIRPFPARLNVIHHLITPRQHNPFPLARYFGSAAKKIFQPGIAYQWYDLVPEPARPAPGRLRTWLQREGVTKIGIPLVMLFMLLIAGLTGFTRYRAGCPDAGGQWIDSLLRTLNLVTLAGITLDGCPAPNATVNGWLQAARLFGGALWAYAILQVYLSVFHNARRWVNVFIWAKLPIGGQNYALIVGLTDQTYALLRDLTRRYKALTVIDPDGTSPHTTAARLMGVNIVVGDPTDAALLRRSYVGDAQKVFVMTGKDDTNVRTAQELEQLTPSRAGADPMDPAESEYGWHVDVREPRKRYLLSQTTRQNERLHPFNLDETMVRRLQIRYPIDRFYQARSSTVSDVVLIGFCPAGQAIVLNTLQLGHFAGGHRVRIHVFTPDHERCRTEFLGRYPYLKSVRATDPQPYELHRAFFPEGTLQFYELPVAETELLDAGFALYRLFTPPAGPGVTQCLITLYVCLENPIQAITLLSELLPRLDHFRYSDRLHHQGPVMTDLQVFCHYEIADEKEVDFMEKRLNSRAAYVPVVLFGNFADECTFDAITARHEDQLAKQVALWYYLLYGNDNPHLTDIFAETMLPPRPAGDPLLWLQTNYARLLADGGAKFLVNMAGICWKAIPEKDRASNRRAADHAWIKLRAIHLQTTETLPPGGEVLAYLDTYRTLLQGHLPELAPLEHRRWCAEKMLEGYAPLLSELPGRRDEVKQLEWSGDKKDKWRQQKLHLDLDLFENLSPKEQQKDNDQILGLPYMLLAIGLRLTDGHREPVPNGTTPATSR